MSTLEHTENEDCKICDGASFSHHCAYWFTGLQGDEYEATTETDYDESGSETEYDEGSETE